MNRTLGQMLFLSAAAVVMCHGTAGAQAPSPLDEILEFQNKLAQRIDYELPKPTTLDEALNDLLARQGIPYEVNEAAFIRAMQDRDVVNKTEVRPIKKQSQVTRAAVLKRLLQQVAALDEKGIATYVLRGDHLEITTMEAKTIEARGARTPPGDVLPDGFSVPLAPLAYAAFNDVPLADALKELAHGTESTILLDGRAAAEAKAKVTAELNGVPVDVAVQLLADMADLKMVRVANVYYVTSVKKAEELQKEEDRRRGQPDENPPAMPHGGSAALTTHPSAESIAKHPVGVDNAGD